MLGFKNSLVLLTVVALSFGCGSPSEKTIITGTVIEPKDSLVKLQRGYLNTDVVVTPLDEHHRFRFELDIEKDTLLFITTGWFLVQAYISPGDSVHLYADYRNFDNTVHFSGTGSEINNLWARLHVINKEKNKFVNHLLRSGELFNIEYVIDKYRYSKHDLINKYLTGNPGLFNTPEKEIITNFYLYLDDWTTYEIYNRYFPRHKKQYPKEIKFSFGDAMPVSYQLLWYAYHYFSNRHPDQNIFDFDTVLRFVHDVDTNIVDKDLADAVKMADITGLLRSSFFELDMESCKHLTAKADDLFFLNHNKKRFFDYMDAYFSSVKNGYFPYMKVTDLFCNRVDLNEVLARAESDAKAVITFSSLKIFEKKAGLLQKLTEQYPDVCFFLLFTQKMPKEKLVRILSRHDLDLNHIYFLNNHDVLYYNFWSRSAPVSYVVDKNLRITEVFPFNEKNAEKFNRIAR